MKTILNDKQEDISLGNQSEDPYSMNILDHIYYEFHRENDACDVIVRMEDGTVYTALFVTLSYLRRQMELCYQVTKQLPDTPPVYYTIIDTPHILVEELAASIIEDTIDNLISLDVFEGSFTRVTESKTPTSRTTNDGKLATQEVAAVVISDVLVIDEH